MSYNHAAAAAAGPAPTLKDEQILTAQDLKKRLDAGDVTICDVRGAGEVAESGKITSDKWMNIPLPELDAALKLSPAEFKEKYLLPKPDPAGAIVFHCAHGRRGAIATALADSMGYSKSANLTGGQTAWKAAYPE